MRINWEKANGTRAKGSRGRAVIKVGKCVESDLYAELNLVRSEGKRPRLLLSSRRVAELPSEVETSAFAFDVMVREEKVPLRSMSLGIDKALTRATLIESSSDGVLCVSCTTGPLL